MKETINFLMKGCSCKKGRCEGMRCGCHFYGNTCGPGCNCRCCSNLPVANEKEVQSEETDSDDDERDDKSSDEYDSEQSDEQTAMEAEIVTDDFDFLPMDLPEFR